MKPRTTRIVAVIASLRDFSEIGDLSAESFDLCELRVDLLYRSEGQIESLSQHIRHPKILTVRDIEEGGGPGLSENERIKLLKKWLPYCDLIDVELRNLEKYSELIQVAESEGKQVILSFHDFVTTPSIKRLQEMSDFCRPSDNRIFKVATNTSHWRDLETLARFLQLNSGKRIAAMGMGEFGKLSRLILPRLGSALVYASLSDAVAPGQWPVRELARILDQIG